MNARRYQQWRRERQAINDRRYSEWLQSLSEVKGHHSLPSMLDLSPAAYIESMKAEYIRMRRMH